MRRVDGYSLRPLAIPEHEPICVQKVIRRMLVKQLPAQWLRARGLGLDSLRAEAARWPMVGPVPEVTSPA